MAHPDFEELLAEFNASRVRYLIGGAHALALHARPRASKDLDVYVDPTPANAARVLDALRKFFGGKVPRYINARSLSEPDTIIQLGVAPVRVDLLSDLATTSFARAWKRRSIAAFGGVRANFLSADDLIAEKEHFARPQDLADVLILKRARAARARKRLPRGRARSSR